MKPGAGAKTAIVIVIIIAIVVPVVLGFALTSKDPYFLNAPTKPSSGGTSTGTAPPNTVYLPLGAGGAQENNFSPSSLTVSSGTTITFIDQDTDAPHNIYFTSMPSGASISANPSATLTNGDQYTVTLTTPGTYHFECQFHPGWMQGTITVTG